MSVARDVLAASVARIQVDTAYLPPIRVDEPFAPGAGDGPSGAIARALRPRVTVTLRGGELLTFAPAGDPGPSRWPLVAGVLVILVVAIGAALILRRR